MSLAIAEVHGASDAAWIPIIAIKVQLSWHGAIIDDVFSCELGCVSIEVLVSQFSLSELKVGS